MNKKAYLSKYMCVCVVETDDKPCRRWLHILY